MAAIPQQCLLSRLHTRNPENEAVEKAYQLLRDQLWALGESGVCTGSLCKCNSVNELVQQVCQAAATALHNSELLLHTSRRPAAA